MQTDPHIVVGRDGLRGALIDPQSLEDSDAGEAVIRLSGGEEIRVPADLLIKQDASTYFLPLSDADIRRSAVPSPGSAEAAPIAASDPRVIPIIEETLDIRKRTVETGVVRIVKTVHEREETVDEPVYREIVDVKRVPINRRVEGPVAVREVDGVTIVPILEEALFVEKRLILKEELHIAKRREEVGRERQTVSLRREEAEIVRAETRA